MIRSRIAAPQFPGAPVYFVLAASGPGRHLVPGNRGEFGAFYLVVSGIPAHKSSAQGAGSTHAGIVFVWGQGGTL